MFTSLGKALRSLAGANTSTSSVIIRHPVTILSIPSWDEGSGETPMTCQEKALFDIGYVYMRPLLGPTCSNGLNQ